MGSAGSLTTIGLESRAPCRSRPLASLPVTVTLGLEVKSLSEEALTLWVARSEPYCHSTVVEGLEVGWR